MRVVDRRSLSRDDTSRNSAARPRPHVLIVDDEPLVCQLMGKMLDVHGWHSDSLASPLEGLRRFAACSKPPELAILDVRMKEMTGLDLAQKFWEPEPQLPILFVSGGSRSSLEIPTDRPARFLAKPFSGQELVEAVRCLTRNSLGS